MKIPYLQPLDLPGERFFFCFVLFFFLTLFIQLLINHQYIFKYTGIFGYHTQTQTPTLNTLYLLSKRKAGSYG